MFIYKALYITNFFSLIGSLDIDMRSCVNFLFRNFIIEENASQIFRILQEKQTYDTNQHENAKEYHFAVIYFEQLILDNFALTF